MEKTSKLEINNDISELQKINTFLEQLGEEWNIQSKLLFKINLALEEIFSNVINYAYTDKDKHIIIVEFSLDDNKLYIKIQDDGQVFNPLEVSEPNISLPVEEREIGGLGIHIVRELMDQVKYSRQNHTNILTLTKILDRSNRE
jgi:serine/threonine-protein kinase RsbW